MSNRSKKYQLGPITEERAYNILKQPVITEKSTMASENNQVVFKVSSDAKKPEIKQAIERIFEVKVTDVNTLNVKGKKKFFRGRVGQRSGYKKAIVTLAEGEMIDVGVGV